jgi:hypothetical protein
MMLWCVARQPNDESIEYQIRLISGGYVSNLWGSGAAQLES